MIPYFIRQCIRQHVTIPLRREIGAFLVESGMSILKIRDPMLPPIRLDYVGGYDFKATGYEFLRYFTEYGGLKPDHIVLDIGSGIGRMAIPMTNYLKKGRYEGIEIVSIGVEWCRKNITSRYPNFQFHHVNIFNKSYNRNGTIKACDYRFPFENNTFDFIFLTSVFTHMLPEDITHYIAEISRVLKTDGRVFSTWFLLGKEAETLITARPDALQIVHTVPGHDHVFAVDPHRPEDITGYDEGFVRDLFLRNGLEVKQVMPGSWCKRADYISYQDMVIAQKTGNSTIS